MQRHIKKFGVCLPAKDVSDLVCAKNIFYASKII